MPDISSVLIQVIDADSDDDSEGYGYEWKLDNLTFTRPDSTLPCDFDADGDCDGQDIDDLAGAIANGTTDPTYDLNQDFAVNLFDLEQWRADAGAINLGPGQVYLPADGNLDGFVDATDFNLWNAHKFTPGRWTQGDWNTDGVVDTSDFNLWNTHKFTSSDHASRDAGQDPRLISSVDLHQDTDEDQREDGDSLRQWATDLVFAKDWR